MRKSTVNVANEYPRLSEELAKYPKHPSITKKLSYGTAGFRDKGEILDSTLYRMGMLAILRSRQQGKIVGLMITASHNLSVDNGVKIVDASGGMLESSWETHAVNLANAEEDEVVDALNEIVNVEKVDMELTGNVFIAKDTRETSDHLSELAREGALVIGGNVLDFALQTTPQLHHYVRMWNHEKYNKGDWASENGYYNMLVDAYKQLTDTEAKSTRSVLYADAAYGVGGPQLAKLGKEMADLLSIEIRNLPGEGELNLNCGAEHCQKGRLPPSGFTCEVDGTKRCCSMDGDADRLVYHYFDKDGNWKLLDGDKISCLFGLFFVEQFKLLKNPLGFGVVQTAYANGASTEYLKQLGATISIAKTGVKYCHHKAEEFDIGMYFEANGHGTVIFKDEAIEKLQKLDGTLNDKAQKAAIAKILAAYQLINQAVGDAMSDLLLVEAVLTLKNWTIQEWDAIYHDFPSRQTKLPVFDRNVIECNESETKVLKPESLQKAIDGLVQTVENGRAFVRPSGTEDVVRVYAEASTQEIADELALNVAKAVHEHGGGVGEKPESFTA